MATSKKSVSTKNTTNTQTHPLFLKFVIQTLKFETGGRKDGAYTNNPSDKGGETKYGISLRSHPDLDIKALTQEAAISIYESEYWNNNYAYIASRKIAFKLFDMGVLSGVPTAVRILQDTVKSLGIKSIKVDKKFGPITLTALNMVIHQLGEDKVYDAFIARYRRHFYWIVFKRPSDSVNLKGWLNRLNTPTKESKDAGSN